MNDALTAEIGQLKDGATRRQRELDTEKNKVRPFPAFQCSLRSVYMQNAAFRTNCRA